MTGPPDTWGGFEPERSFASFADVTPIEPKFIERPLIQAGTFHLFAGKPGVGKGALCARWIARCTNGEMYGRPRRALWLASEEDPARDLRPRLDVAGANVSMVAPIANSFRLPQDIEHLRAEAQAADVGLIVLDPLSNHLNGTNTNADEEVRHALQPLTQLAHEIDTPILGIRHVSTKEARGGFVSRILGSTAWTAVSRVVLGIALDRDGGVHVRAVKGNRVRATEAGVRFELESAQYLDWTETVVRAIEAGESFEDIDSLLESSKRTGTSEAARAAVIRILRAAGGVMESDTLDAAVVAETGLVAKTVRNLRTELRDRGWLRAYPEREGDRISRWLVSLTNAAPYDRELDPVITPSGEYRDLAKSDAQDPGSVTLQLGILSDLDSTSPSGTHTSRDLGEAPPEYRDLGETDHVITTTSEPLNACPTCGSTDVGELSGRCHACGERVNPIDVG